MSEKSVIAVIVEGSSDESAIGGILKEYFSSEETRFAVVHGDITSDFNTKVENVLLKIDDLIGAVKDKYGYFWEDFLKIIHIGDTDGAFTKGCIKQAEVNDIMYYEDHIEYFSIEEVEKRNKHKSEIMFKLYSTGKVHGIPYRFFFNSCNLEHVLYNQLNDFTDEEKEEMADDFSDKYEGRVLEFIDFISDETVAVPGTYKQTWKFIEKGNHSLCRYSNMHLIFR